MRRRLAVGAEVVPGRGVHFRVWAPDHEQVTLVLEDDGAGGPVRELGLEPGAEGYHSVLAPGARAGDHLGLAQEFVSAMKYGYLYQGQRYSWQRKSRGTPTWGIPPASFVNFIENHDQVANSDRGRRMHQRSSPGRPPAPRKPRP